MSKCKILYKYNIKCPKMPPNCVFDVSSKMYAPTEEDVNECFERVQAFELKPYTEKYIDLFRKVVESP